MDLKVIGIIPARGGSKGIPQKNIYPLAGKPLIAYTIEEAKKSKFLERVIVSTEDVAIAQIAQDFGAEVVMRPDEYATDNSPTGFSRRLEIDLRFDSTDRSRSMISCASANPTAILLA